MAVLTARSSTIFIAEGNTTRVYHSLDEMPSALKRKLQQSTRGNNSGTIVIADKRGREELMRALNQPTQIERPAQIRVKVAKTITSPPSSAEPAKTQQETPRKAPARLHLGSLRIWLEILLPIALGASLWFFFQLRF